MSETHSVLGTSPVASLDDHLRRGGGRGLTAARYREPDSIITAIERSGLRGRGGAGFPTGRKWRTLAGVHAAAESPLPVIVNAAEGEPGTFKDRSLLRSNPYLVIEGAAIAALAIGAREIIFATKRSFRDEVRGIRTAIAEIESAAWLPGISIEVVDGPGEYLFGEETALLEVVDGRPPFPRIAPPYRRGVNETGSIPGWGPGARRGDGPGALVDNVETLANVVGILAHGADWYRGVGTDRSPGTIICTVTGATQHHGVGEFAMGTSLREVIETVGGGTTAGRSITAVLNGVSNPPLTPDQLGTPLTYEDMTAIGSGLGSASFIVIDDETSLLAVAAGVARFLAVESCGQCVPCKRDGLDLAGSLGDAVLAGTGLASDHVLNRLSTVARGARCALAGQTERVVGRLVDLAGAGPIPPATAVYPIVPVVEISNGRAVLDMAHLDKRSDWTFPEDGHPSQLWPVDRLADHPVEINPTHTPESRGPDHGSAPDVQRDDGSQDPFASIVALDEKLSAQIDELRKAGPGERQGALHSLRLEIERYRRATESLIYPLIDRLDAETGADIAWYPQHHTRAAERLLRDLDLGNTPVSPGMVDQLCADVHASIIEVERRVLPMIEAALSDSEAEVVGGDLQVLIEDS